MLDVITHKCSVVQLHDIMDRYELTALNYNSIGNAFRELGAYEKAEKAYLRSIEMAPSYDESYGNLLSLYIKTQNFDNYEDIYKKGMENADKKSFIIYQDGRHHFLQGNYEMALTAARANFMDEGFEDELIFDLGLRALIQLIRKGDNREAYIEEAFKLWEIARTTIPDSDTVREFTHFFEEE